MLLGDLDHHEELARFGISVSMTSMSGSGTLLTPLMDGYGTPILSISVLRTAVTGNCPCDPLWDMYMGQVAFCQ